MWRSLWLRVGLTGAGMAIGLTAANVTAGRSWDVIVLGLGLAAAATVVLGVVATLASRPRVRSARHDRRVHRRGVRAARGARFGDAGRGGGDPPGGR